MGGYLLNHDRLFDAVAWFIGYSQVTASTHKVRRWTPAIHPRWPFMRCVECSIKGVEFDGRETSLSNYPTLKKSGLPVYARYRFDLTYQNLQYDCREDHEVTDEWSRFITVDSNNQTEIITLDGGQYKYIAPSNPALNATPVVLNGPQLKVYAQRAGLIVRSYGLPAHYILNEHNIPVQLLSAVGRVNSTDLLGLTRGTMLMTDYRIEKKAQPIATRAAGELLFSMSLLELQFTHTDPPRAEASETRRGWQVYPAHTGVSTAGWYGIKNSADEDLYPYFDHNKCLHKHSA
jgi:hypothetical protein